MTLIDFAKEPTEDFLLEQIQENAFLSINALNNAVQGFDLATLTALAERLEELAAEIDMDIAEIRSLAAMVTALSSAIAANTVLANNAQTRADEAFTLASTHSTDIANNTAAIANAVAKAEEALTAANAATATANAAQSAAATNTGNISTNTTNIGTNTSNIATNTTAIGGNTDEIVINASNISANTNNISTNTSNIATNSSDIDDIETSYVVDTVDNGDQTYTVTISKAGTQSTVVIEGISAAQAGQITTNTNNITTILSAYLKSVSVTSDVVTITDQDDVTTMFGALPTPNLGNAGKILQQSADGTVWNLVSLAAATQSARELPCFAYAGAINNFLTRSLYAVTNILAMNAWDPATSSFVEANLTATDTIVPCNLWDPSTQSYTAANIPLE